MSSIRKQLSMYASDNLTANIEEVRNKVDPIQCGLIPVHITLCREDELVNLSRIKERLLGINFTTLNVSFAMPKRFGGHGLIMECIKGEESFREIREYILESTQIRRQSPHITLAHPRNTKAKGNSIITTLVLPELLELEFLSINLIEQNKNKPWDILTTYHLS